MEGIKIVQRLVPSHYGYEEFSTAQLVRGTVHVFETAPLIAPHRAMSLAAHHEDTIL